jgi:hypothetical protein
MALEVTVALVGDRTAPGPGNIREGEWDWTWGEREKVTLVVEDNETVGDVMDRAAEALGVGGFAYERPPSRDFSWVAFDDVKATTPLYERMIPYGLTVIDEYGRALWHVPFAAARYRQVIHAAEVGVISGDPCRLYLIRSQSQGDFSLVDWQTFLELYGLAKLVLDGIGQARAGIDNVRAAGEAIGRGINVIKTHLPEWTQRGVTSPNDISELVATVASSEAQAALGVQDSELESLAAILDGADEVEGRETLDIVHGELERLAREAGWGYDMRRLIEDRIRRLLTGDAEPLRLEDYRLPTEVLFPGMPPVEEMAEEEENYGHFDETDAGLRHLFSPRELAAAGIAIGAAVAGFMLGRVRQR